MNRAGMLFIGVSSLLIFSASVFAATPTFIEGGKDGKRLLFFFGDAGTSYIELTVEATHKSAISFDAKEIVDSADRKTVLVVDDADVRHSSNGLVLATFDNEQIVHGRHGKVISYYHHPDICPKFGAEPMYRVNGAPLSKLQLVAVLYQLKPELFTLTDEEKAAQKMEIVTNAAEADRLAKMDPIPRKWQVLNGHGAVENVGAGDITFAPKKGEAYPVTFDHSAGGGPKWTGVAIHKRMPDGDQVVFAAYGTAKTIGMCIYEIKGGTLSGKWYPWYIDGDPKNVGTEELKGPESLDGDFTIVSAKSPTTGVAYSGTVSIKPTEIVGAGDKEKPYLVTWTFGATKVQGIGIRTGDFLIVSSGAGADVNIAKFKLENGGATFNGDWFKLGSKEMGQTAAMN